MESSLGGRSDLSTSCCGSIESSEEQERGPSLDSCQIYISGSSCSPLNWRDQVCGPLSSLHSYGQDSDSDCVSSQGNHSLALAGLRGSVSQGDLCYAGPFFKDVERDVREVEDELSAADSVINEGIIFYNDVCSVLHQSTSCLLFWFEVWFCQTNLLTLLFCQKIQPVDSEYKEGREYVLSEFVKEGSYGEVHSAQDVNTGFKFAVKKVKQSISASLFFGVFSFVCLF